MATSRHLASGPTDRLVFVLEEKIRVDFSPAKRYGDVCFVFEAGDEKASIWSASYYDAAISKMLEKSYDSDIDYLVAVGSQVPVLLLSATLVARFGQVNLLLFDSTTSEYVHKRVAIKQEHSK